ncbi:PqqD family peptide modification chaperone [Streptomyces sp. TP-A0874]|uniref:PqqD family peptide modification chaperone n=1 Tax=Streptomyces sp. TP-A0874 TaxID=549819 RepID=UPI0008537ED1|nr:PqqD family peptide modification chaperone [Streptomyces sp. TP-A0874]
MKLRDQERLALTETEYGGLLLDRKSGDFWHLSPSAAKGTRALLAGGGVEEAARDIRDSCDTTEQQAAEDVRTVLEILRAVGVVEG